MKFKILIGVLVIGAAVWFGWWWVAATGQEQALTRWLDDRRAAGWQAEASDITVSGFPNRLDTTLVNPALADPASGWAWSAPFLSIFQVIYDPTRFIVVWPQEQDIAAPGARARITHQDMRASFAFARSGALTLERMSLEIDDARAEADDWRAAIQSWVHHIRAAPDAGPSNAYEFRADGAGLMPPEFVRRWADPAGAMPKAIETIALEGRAAFDKPLDRRAFEGEKPELVALSLKEARAVWGALSLSATGSLRADEGGYAEGTLDIEARNWREMLDAAVAAGAIDTTLADAMRTGLGLLARLSGDRNLIRAPLTFSGGFTRIGPVPIGPAPRMLR